MRGSKTEVSPGVWRLRVYTGNRRANGSPVLLSKTVKAPERKAGAGARLADRELAKMVADAERGNLRPIDATVGQLLQDWLAHLENVGRSHTTVREYRRLAEKVIGPELGHLRLTKLTSRHLDGLYAKEMARGVKPISVRRVHAVMHAALHQARKWQMVPSNVAEDATPPEFHVERVKAPSPEQVRTILAAAEDLDPTLAVLLLIAALTGARRGELCSMRWSDVDWESATLTISRSVYEIRGGGWASKSTKTHQTRRIGLDDLALAVLRRHRSYVETIAASLGLTVPPDAFMFSRSPVGSEPVRPNVVTQFTGKVAKRTGVAFHLHGLRHFSATQAIAGGYDAVTVAARLGHADPSVTLRVYSHAIEQRDRQLASALGKQLALPRSSPRGGSRRRKTG